MSTHNWVAMCDFVTHLYKLLASYAEITQVIRFENKHLFPQKFTKQFGVILRNTREFNDILKI
jgi:hypothetical protein